MPHRINLFATIALMCVCCSISVAQSPEDEITVPRFQEYRPGWSVFPSVRRPSFNYGEVSNSKLIAEAAENLYFLSIDHLLVGNVRSGNGNETRGYQVIGPRGEVFYVDNIAAPKCGVAIVAQQIESENGYISSQPGAIVSTTYIGEINFEGCY